MEEASHDVVSLLQSDRPFRSIFEFANIGMALSDLAGNILYVNPAFLALTGYEAAALYKTRLLDITHPAYRPQIGRLLGRLLSGDIPSFNIEKRLVRAGGEVIWVRNSVSLLPERSPGHVPDEPDMTRVIVLAEDITERKQAERELRLSEERFRLLVEGARDYAMFVTDRDMVVQFWSTGAVRLFGWSEAEALGQNAEFIFTPEEKEAGLPEQERRTALAEGRAVDRRWHLRKDGSRFWADGLLMRLDDDGRVRGFAKIARDATEQKHAEELVQKANQILEERVQERTRSSRSAPRN